LLREGCFVDVADGDDLDILKSGVVMQMGARDAAGSDHCDAKVFVGLNWCGNFLCCHGKCLVNRQPRGPVLEVWKTRASLWRLVARAASEGWDLRFGDLRFRAPSPRPRRLSASRYRRTTSNDRNTRLRAPTLPQPLAA